MKITVLHDSINGRQLQCQGGTLLQDGNYSTSNIRHLQYFQTAATKVFTEDDKCNICTKRQLQYFQNATTIAFPQHDNYRIASNWQLQYFQRMVIKTLSKRIEMSETGWSSCYKMLWSVHVLQQYRLVADIWNEETLGKRWRHLL